MPVVFVLLLRMCVTIAIALTIEETWWCLSSILNKQPSDHKMRTEWCNASS